MQSSNLIRILSRFDLQNASDRILANHVLSSPLNASSRAHIVHSYHELLLRFIVPFVWQPPDAVACHLLARPSYTWVNCTMQQKHEFAKKCSALCKMNQRPSIERLTESNQREPRSSERLPALEEKCNPQNLVMPRPGEVASDGLWKTLHSTIIIYQKTLYGSTFKVMLKICVWLLD